MTVDSAPGGPEAAGLFVRAEGADVAGPMWVHWALATVMVLSAAYHLGRARLAGRAGPTWEADVSHLAMSAAMAMMLLAGPHPGWSLLCAAAFVPAAFYFMARAGQAMTTTGPVAVGPPLRQGVVTLAMVFMLAVAAGVLAPATVRPGTASAHHPVLGQLAGTAVPTLTGDGARVSLVAVTMVTALLAVAVAQLVQLRRPSLRLTGQLAMTGTMAFMLVPLI